MPIDDEQDEDIQLKTCGPPPGSGLVLQHYTPNEECAATEELEPVDKNLQYDFNFQVFHYIT